MVGPLDFGDKPIHGENGDGHAFVAAEQMRCPECKNEEFHILRQDSQDGEAFMLLALCNTCKSIIQIGLGVRL